MSETAPTYAARERPVLTPSQLNKLARTLLEDAFAQVWVEGEVSNYTRAASGHWYFTLKDSGAQIRCAMFKSNNLYVRVRPADGVQVLVRGRISLYEARGDYQLIAEHMEEAGLGRLMREFERLKALLQAEGLTDPARKRALPRMPRRMAVITSAQGAAIRDVLSVCARRWPLLAIDVYPAQVQGADAPVQLRAALAAAQPDAGNVGPGVEAVVQPVVARKIQRYRASGVGGHVDRCQFPSQVALLDRYRKLCKPVAIAQKHVGLGHA